MTAESFYEREGETFVPTDATSSPWDPRAQHGGPPAALAAFVLAERHPRDDAIFARISTDFLGPIPKSPMRLHTRVVRPGGRVELLEATFEDPRDERVPMIVRAWRIRTAAQALPEAAAELPPPLPPPEETQFYGGISDGWGYGRAIEWRFVRGSLQELGPSDVWSRVRIPLVAGTPLDPLSRLLVVADSTNGLSIELPVRDYLSIPPGLTVTIGRYPDGEWVYFATRTQRQPHGVGIAEGRAADERGTLALIAQPLLLEPRAVQTT